MNVDLARFRLLAGSLLHAALALVALGCGNDAASDRTQAVGATATAPPATTGPAQADPATATATTGPAQADPATATATTGPAQADPATATAAPATTGPKDDELPSGILLLGPEYQAAYRLLPDGPWARQFVDQLFGAIWTLDSLSWDEAPPVPHPGDTSKLSRASGDDRQWIIQRIREHDPDSAAEFESAADVVERMKALEAFASKGFGKEFDLIPFYYDAMKEGLDADATQKKLEAELAFRESMAPLLESTAREGVIRSDEFVVCLLLIEMALGEDPPPGSECDIAQVTEGVRQRLSSGAGYPHKDEHWREFNVPDHQFRWEGASSPLSQ